MDNKNMMLDIKESKTNDAVDNGTSPEEHKSKMINLKLDWTKRSHIEAYQEELTSCLESEGLYQQLNETNTNNAQVNLEIITKKPNCTLQKAYTQPNHFMW